MEWLEFPNHHPTTSHALFLVVHGDVAKANCAVVVKEISDAVKPTQKKSWHFDSYVVK